MTRKGFSRKSNNLKSSAQKCLNDNPRKNSFKNKRPGGGWVKVQTNFFKLNQIVCNEIFSGFLKKASRYFGKNQRACEFGQCLCFRKGYTTLVCRTCKLHKKGFTKCYSWPFKATEKVYNEALGMFIRLIEVQQKKTSLSRFLFQSVATFAFQWYILSYDNIYKISRKSCKIQKFSVIRFFFLDGHKSHLSYALSLLCNELQIDTFALYPNATRILQPCDVAIFRPLKKAWRRTVREWDEEYPQEVLNKVTFASS